MLTQNCDAHPLLRQFHKPDPNLPADKQDKRSVVPIAREHWDTWLNGSIEEARALIRLPAADSSSTAPPTLTNRSICQSRRGPGYTVVNYSILRKPPCADPTP